MLRRPSGLRMRRTAAFYASMASMSVIAISGKPRSIFATAPTRQMLVAAAFNINQRNRVRGLLIKSFFEERRGELAAVLAMS
jgi:hypothetical protein